MSLRKHIPNSITLLNLFCGTIAVIFAVQGDLVSAAVFVGAGIFLDFFDGLAARLLDVKTELGLQLDSLADMVTSGGVPGIVMFQLLSSALENPGSAGQEWQEAPGILEWNFPWLALTGLFVSLASGYRLAKFNLDERQTDSFIGLPTPANALLILSLPLILVFQPQPFAVSLIMNPWFLAGLVVFSCFMLNAEIPLFALKFRTWGLGQNKVRYGFLLYCLLLLVLLQFLAVPVIILSYVLLSVLTTPPAERSPA